MGLKKFVLVCLLFIVSVCVVPGAASALKFEPADTSPLTGPISPGDTDSGDLNDDGFDDLVVGASGESGVGRGLYVWLGNEQGTFTAAPGSPLLSDGTMSHVAVGQLNPDTDSNLDVIAFNGGSSFVTLLGDGDGTFTAAGSTEMGFNPSGGVELGDLDGDGVLDLAGASFPNRVAAALNDGEGVFTVGPLQTITGGTEFDSLTIGDFDGDGKADLAMSNFSLSSIANWAVFAAKGNGDGTFADVAGNPFQMASGNIARSVVALDLNGDALDDLAISTQPGNDPSQNEIQTMLGNATTFLAPNPGQTARSDDTPFNIFGGDIDGDGFDDDAATANFGGGNVSVGLGDHAGGFALAPGSPFSVGTPPPGFRYFPQDGTVGDFDGDGAPDMAMGSSASGTGVVMGVTVLLAEPDLGFTTESVEFGDLLVDPDEPADQSVTLLNDGTVGTGVESVAIAGPDADQFDVDEPGAECDLLEYQGECELQVQFDPTSPGAKEATLEVTTGESGDPIEIALTGTGLARTPEVEVDPGSVTFPETLTGTTSPTREVTITSTGDAPFQLKGAAKTGIDASEFTLDGPACVGSSLPVGESCVLTVGFAPSSAGAKSATLTIMAEPEAENITVRLSGTATAPTPPPPPPPPPPPDPPVLTTSAKLSLKAPKKVKRGKRLKVTATVTNTGETALSGVVLAAKVPGGLAKAPKKLKIASIPVGKTVKKTIVVAVKKKAKKGKKLTVSASATTAGTKLSSAKVAARIR